MRLWWFPLIVACNGRCGRESEDCEQDDLRTFYLDSDGDGHGDPLEPVEECELPKGASTVGDDCDDQDGSAWVAASLWPDGDGDGHGAGDAVEVCLGAEGYSDESGDCDDSDANRYPGAPTVCGDGADQDCDELPDCEALSGSAMVADVATTRFYGDVGSGLGSAVAGLGDLNGDGLDDLAIGAPDASWGQALVYLSPPQAIEDVGGADTTLTAEVTDGSATAIQLGASLAAADLTGDGVRDVLVGAGDGVRASMGSSIFIVPGPLSNGDITVNDGVSALVIVAAGGRSMLTDLDYAGSEDMDLIAAGYGVSLIRGPVTSSGELEDLRSGELNSSTERFGEALALGDLYGDSELDLLVGSSLMEADLPGSEEIAEVGGAFVFGTSSDFHESALGYYNYDDLAIYGLTDGARLGAAAAFTGDQDGDGYDDIYVGAPGAEDDDGAATGAVYYFDGASLAALDQESEIYADTATLTLFGGAAGDEFGAALLSGLDIDGNATLVVGAPGHDDETGAVALWYGQPSAGDTLYEADYRVSGTAEGDRFGATLANAGDTNGLGWDDLLIGAPGTSGGDGAGWLLVFDQL